MFLLYFSVYNMTIVCFLFHKYSEVGTWENETVSLLQVLTLISVDSYHEEMPLCPEAHCDSHYLCH